MLLSFSTLINLNIHGSSRNMYCLSKNNYLLGTGCEQNNTYVIQNTLMASIECNMFSIYAQFTSCPIYIYIYIYIYNIHIYVHFFSFDIKIVKRCLFFLLLQYSIEISLHIDTSINFYYFSKRHLIMNN